MTAAVGPAVHDSSTEKHFYYVFAFPVWRPRDKSASDDQFLLSDIRRVLYHCLLCRYQVRLSLLCILRRRRQNKMVINQTERLKKHLFFVSALQTRVWCLSLHIKLSLVLVLIFYFKTLDDHNSNRWLWYV